MNRIRTLLWIVWLLVFFPVFIVAYLLDSNSTIKLLKGYIEIYYE